MTKNKKVLIACSTLILVLFILIPTLGSLDNMLQEPNITPQDFLNQYPSYTITIGGKSLTATQLSSTVLVYLLGFMGIILGSYFAISKEKSSLTWGISLIFWGVAALLAGTSYQWLGYELKAHGREFVLFTSWFEIFYMLLQCISTSFMLYSVGLITLETQRGRDNMLYYSLAISVIYPLLMLIGVLINNTFLVSYTGFLVFVGYNYLIMFILSVKHYRKHHDKLNKNMMIIWISFLLVNIFYFIHLYASSPIDVYKNTGIWFTENDTLHVLLMVWFIEIFFLLRNKLIDKKLTESI